MNEIRDIVILSAIIIILIMVGIILRLRQKVFFSGRVIDIEPPGVKDEFVTITLYTADGEKECKISRELEKKIMMGDYVELSKRRIESMYYDMLTYQRPKR